MASKNQQLSDGTNFSVIYGGDGDGTISITLQPNSGLERTASIVVKTTDGSVTRTISLKQIGKTKVTKTVTLYPSSYNSTDYAYQSVVSGYALSNPVGKGSTSTSMCRVNLKTGSRAVSYVYYNFDCSSIPSNATIESVTCKVKCYINQTNANRVATRQVQLFSGSTAKGSAATMSASTTALNVTAGNWTRAELDNCRMRLYAVRGTNSTTTTYYMGLYGADLTITYSYYE